MTAVGRLVRRGLIVALAAVIASTAGLGQNRLRQANIGYISPSDSISINDYLRGVRRGLSNRGYVEGRILVIEERYADGFTDRLPSLISGLLAKKMDLLMAVGSQTAIVAQHLTSSVPIVFLSGDPIKAGLVPSLTHPGANLTGLSLASTEYSVKWPELLKEVAPNLRSVALVWNPANPVVVEEVERIRHIAPKLGLEIETFSLSSSNIDGSLAAISAAGVDGLILMNDAVVESFAGRLIAFAAERDLPAIWGSGFAPRQGALMSYSSNYFALGQRAAHYVDRILKGTSPSDLPIEQTTVFTLCINLKTAKALGLTVPPELLATADEVIE
jgi:putative ABC transport system substrate-binding protein